MDQSSKIAGVTLNIWNVIMKEGFLPSNQWK